MQEIIMIVLWGHEGGF